MSYWTYHTEQWGCGVTKRINKMKKHRKTMIVKIHNIDQSQPMVFEGIDNTYVKEGLFCLVNRDKNEVQKYPMSRIFRIIEPYDPSAE